MNHLTRDVTARQPRHLLEGCARKCRPEKAAGIGALNQRAQHSADAYGAARSRNVCSSLCCVTRAHSSVARNRTARSSFGADGNREYPLLKHPVIKSARDLASWLRQSRSVGQGILRVKIDELRNYRRASTGTAAVAGDRRRNSRRDRVHLSPATRSKLFLATSRPQREKNSDR
jgi:hypothetical protein